MNNLKKKWLNLYTTLTMYQNAYRLKSGFLAGVTGLCSFGHVPLVNVTNDNSSLKTLDTKETITDTLYDEDTYYNLFAQILNIENNSSDYNSFFDEIDTTLNISKNYSEDVKNLINIILNNGNYTKIKEKVDNVLVVLENESRGQTLNLFARNTSEYSLEINIIDMSEPTYERHLSIFVGKNQELTISLMFYDQKGNIINYPCIYQILYGENNKNLVMVVVEPLYIEDGKVVYDNNGMNYNVTGNEYEIFKIIIESYFNGLSFEDTRNILKEYILNYEELPIPSESILIEDEELREKQLKILTDIKNNRANYENNERRK